MRETRGAEGVGSGQQPFEPNRVTVVPDPKRVALELVGGRANDAGERVVRATSGHRFDPARRPRTSARWPNANTASKGSKAIGTPSRFRHVVVIPPI